MGSEGNSKKSKNNDVGGSGEGSTSGLQELPSTTKKLIQNLKDIVNVPEQEIYAVLKECDMDPNVAIETLLSQDTFHVVKSKRERRKELQMKETQESKSHINSTGHNREGRALQKGPSHMSYDEPHNLLNNGEHGSIFPSISSSTTPVIGRHTDSDSFSINGTQQLAVKNDLSSTSVPSSQPLVSAWTESRKRHLSMAEIVKMGKPPKDSQMFTETFHPFEGSTCSYQVKSTQVSSSQPERNQALDFQNNPDLSFLDDEECGIEKKIASNLPLSDMHAASGEMANQHSNLPGCRSSSFINHDVDAIEFSSDDLFGRGIRSDNESVSSAFSMKNSAERAVYETELKDCSTSTYDSCIYAQQCEEATANVQRLSNTQTEEKVEVILPNHLQAVIDDCPYLSFGTYIDGSNSATPMPILSNAVINDRKESTAISTGFLNSSNSANIGSSLDNYRASMGNDNYGYLASSLQEQMKQVFPNATPGGECINSLSDNDPNFSITDLQTSFYRGEDLRSRDFAAFPAEKAVCSDSIAREFLASSLKSPRALQSSYNILQSMPSIYNTASSMSVSSFSMPEVTKPSFFSLSQQSPLHSQRLGTQPVDRLANPIFHPSSHESNVHKVPPNLQHLYSDGSGYNLLPDMKYGLQHNRNESNVHKMPPNLQPLYSDGSGYNLLPDMKYGLQHNINESNVHKMPPNLQPLYSDGSGYNLLPDMKYGLQHNRNEVSMSRISLFDRDTSTAGNLRSLARNPGSFMPDSPKASANSRAYHNIQPSQYRGANNLNPLKQNECFPMHGLGHESAMRSSLSSMPHGMRHNQQLGEYQQAQVASSYGVSWNSDLSPSHTGILPELSRLGDSREYSKHSLHTWQH